MRLKKKESYILGPFSHKDELLERGAENQKEAEIIEEESKRSDGPSDNEESY
eukprot:CAMPEP_0202967502 /NCGR_PEP_ID=MMETSP1396-20130829/12372_1 /ASSEMBLY_ACC=CAM_ASM_000872 /TAXON_ID= /ORGANISM="Pseudokeronopsis sp., Strain Brazil" /LENGTH=51 /DNA_ID=CAMNT_0049692583 /DNA_START=421 /DNA_END=576 /DNA_ORIENTATION=-